MLESSPAGRLSFKSQLLSASAVTTALTIQDFSFLGFQLQLSSVLKNPHGTQYQWKQLRV